MERKSFLKVAAEDANGVSMRSDAPSGTKNFFHGVDLSTQPFLTKRGRKIRGVVKRVFVILDGTYCLLHVMNILIIRIVFQVISFTFAVHWHQNLVELFHSIILSILFIHMMSVINTPTFVLNYDLLSACGVRLVGVILIYLH